MAAEVAPSSASKSLAPPPPQGACDACGADAADDGDGYCRVCGHKLATAASHRAASPLTAGMRLGNYMVRQSTGDRATASSPDGSEVLLVVGEPEALAAEAKALERIGERTDDPRAFPRVVERDDDATGAFLALSAPSNAARMLADVVQNRTVEQTVAAIAGLLELARRVEAAGYTFQPSPSDLLLLPDGSVILSRLRGAQMLPRGGRLDARRLLESLSEIFLAPAILGPTSLVRLLVPSRETQARAGASIDQAEAELGRVKEELSKPKPRAAMADICDPGLWRPYNQDSDGDGSRPSPRGRSLRRDGGLRQGLASSFSERASQVAARAARDVLGHFARSPDITYDSGASAVAQAIRAAHLAICADHVAEPRRGSAGHHHRRRARLQEAAHGRLGGGQPRLLACARAAPSSSPTTTRG